MVSTTSGHCWVLWKTTICRFYAILAGRRVLVGKAPIGQKIGMNSLQWANLPCIGNCLRGKLPGNWITTIPVAWNPALNHWFRNFCGWVSRLWTGSDKRHVHKLKFLTCHGVNMALGKDISVIRAQERLEPNYQQHNTHLRFIKYHTQSTPSGTVSKVSLKGLCDIKACWSIFICKQFYRALVKGLIYANIAARANTTRKATLHPLVDV